MCRLIYLGWASQQSIIAFESYRCRSVKKNLVGWKTPRAGQLESEFKPRRAFSPGGRVLVSSIPPNLEIDGQAILRASVGSLRLRAGVAESLRRDMTSGLEVN